MRTHSSLKFRGQRRRGQALLLAVLVMIFAALLGAAFIAVVSINLNQTSRQQDKSAADHAAKAGLDYVDHQLTYSQDGKQWYKTNFENNTTYQNLRNQPDYYSPLDRAQGWTDFMKLPDPSAPKGDGPEFLFKVEDITSGEKQGAQKITVIGLSPDDPTAYSTKVAYKGGYMREPLGRVMRTVSNWDFDTGQMPQGQVQATTSSSATLVVSNLKGTLPDLPFYIMVGDPVNTPTGTAPRTAVVVAKSVSGGTATLTLATTISTTAGETVQLCAGLGQAQTGGVLGVDFNHDGTITDGATPSGSLDERTPTLFDVSQATTDGTTPTSGGVRVNGGLSWWGKGLAVNLNPLDATSGVAATVFCSGAMVTDASAAGATTEVTQPSGGTIITNPNSEIAPDSSTGSFPEAASNDWGSGSPLDKLKLVQDGWNGLDKSQVSAERSISNFTPPNFSSGLGLQRYRNMTLNSEPAVSSDPPVASAFGFGKGVYINNPDDVEKVYDSTITGFRDMSQEELQDLWNPKSTGTGDYSRLDPTTTPFAKDVTSTTLSLEELHQRGWVSPDQFIPRGATIELIESDPFADATLGAGPKLAITLDNIADNTATDTTRAVGPVTEKCWKDPSTQQPVAGVYRKVIAWPANGVVMAEGNIRIVGEVTDAPYSLTVVSQSNIYIEGSVGVNSAANDARLLLLARRNVVVNPTQVLQQADAATLLDADITTAIPASSINQTITVVDSTAFHVGDFISIGTNGLRGVIVDVPSITTLSVRVTAPSGTGAVAAKGDVVRVVKDSVLSTSNVPFCNRIASNTDGFQRRVRLDSTADTATLRLVLDHVGLKTTAFTISTQATPGDSKSAVTAIATLKQNQVSGSPNLSAGGINQADKLLRVKYDVPSVPTSGTDNFPTSAPTTEAAAHADTLTALAAEMTPPAPTAAHPTGLLEGWTYAATPAAGYANMPFYYLAAIGNRAKASTTTPDTLDISSSTGMDIPVATSIRLWANGVGSPTTNPHGRLLQSDHFDSGTLTFDTSGQFGFSPDYLDTSSLAKEDALTVDRSFYQDDVDYKNSVLDSRRFDGLVANAWNSICLIQSTGTGETGIDPNEVAPNKLAEYRIRHAKLEDVTFDATSGAPTEIKPGATISINAFVDAQEGSWYVIPGDYFSNQIKSDPTVPDATYCDYNENGAPNPGEFVNPADPTNPSPAYGPNCFADINRNGVQDPEEKPALYRYHRYNYAIKFVGAIMENNTALINDAGSYPGAVREWTDKWATVDVTDVSGTPTFTPGVIQYAFDPIYAQGGLDAKSGFFVPVAPGLAYES